MSILYGSAVCQLPQVLLSATSLSCPSLFDGILTRGVAATLVESTRQVLLLQVFYYYGTCICVVSNIVFVVSVFTLLICQTRTMLATRDMLLAPQTQVISMDW